MSRRAWFWAPQWHWYGWQTLLPVDLGGDEHGRRTIVLGWPVTGRVIIAYWTCRCAECDEVRRETRELEAEFMDPDPGICSL